MRHKISVSILLPGADQLIFTALKWFDAEGNEEKYEIGRDLETLAD